MNSMKLLILALVITFNSNAQVLLKHRCLYSMNTKNPEQEEITMFDFDFKCKSFFNFDNYCLNSVTVSYLTPFGGMFDFTEFFLRSRNKTAPHKKGFKTISHIVKEPLNVQYYKVVRKPETIELTTQERLQDELSNLKYNDNIHKIISKYSKFEVRVYLPRFKHLPIDYHFNIESIGVSNKYVLLQQYPHGTKDKCKSYSYKHDINDKLHINFKETIKSKLTSYSERAKLKHFKDINEYVDVEYKKHTSYVFIVPEIIKHDYFELTGVDRFGNCLQELKDTKETSYKDELCDMYFGLESITV